MSEQRSILIVDDDAHVLFVLQHTLSRLGSNYEILPFGNGLQALHYIRSQHIDLLITDIRVPGCSGVELTEALRTIDASVPVIWISAYDGHDIRLQAKELGVFSYLKKPLEIDQIRGTAMQALQAIHTSCRSHRT